MGNKLRLKIRKYKVTEVILITSNMNKLHNIKPNIKQF